MYWCCLSLRIVLFLGRWHRAAESCAYTIHRETASAKCSHHSAGAFPDSCTCWAPLREQNSFQEHAVYLHYCHKKSVPHWSTLFPAYFFSLELGTALWKWESSLCRWPAVCLQFLNTFESIISSTDNHQCSGYMHADSYACTLCYNVPGKLLSVV